MMLLRLTCIALTLLAAASAVIAVCALYLGDPRALEWLTLAIGSAGWCNALSANHRIDQLSGD